MTLTEGPTGAGTTRALLIASTTSATLFCALSFTALIRLRSSARESFGLRRQLYTVVPLWAVLQCVRINLAWSQTVGGVPEARVSCQAPSPDALLPLSLLNLLCSPSYLFVLQGTDTYYLFLWLDWMTVHLYALLALVLPSFATLDCCEATHTADSQHELDSPLCDIALTDLLQHKLVRVRYTYTFLSLFRPSSHRFFSHRPVAAVAILAVCVSVCVCVCVCVYRVSVTFCCSACRSSQRRVRSAGRP
jgi:hypothetical protein